MDRGEWLEPQLQGPIDPKTRRAAWTGRNPQGAVVLVGQCAKRRRFSRATNAGLPATNAGSRATNARSRGTLRRSRVTNARSRGTLRRSRVTNARSRGTLRRSRATNARSRGTLRRSRATNARSCVTVQRSCETIEREERIVAECHRDRVRRKRRDGLADVSRGIRARHAKTSTRRSNLERCMQRWNTRSASRWSGYL
jgi:hypothetical protein